MRIQLALVFSIVVALAGTATAGEGSASDAVVLATAVVGDGTTGALLDAEHKVLIVEMADAASWDDMRARVKDAQARLDADGSQPGYGVALLYPGDAIAFSEIVDGRARTTVGNGHTMLQDRKEYTLAASPAAVQRSSGYSWGSGYRAGEKVTCKGTAQNLGAAPVEITVRCAIHGVVSTGSSAAWRTDDANKQTQAVVLATMDKSLGVVKPGKKAKYSFKLTLTDVKQDTSLAALCAWQCSVESMSFEQRYLVDGTDTAYFDELTNAEGKAWLALLATLAKEGLKLRVNGTFDPRATYQTFTAGAPFATLTGKARQKSAKAIYKKLFAHAKKYAKAQWYTVYLTDESGTSIGKIDDGKFVEGL